MHSTLQGKSMGGGKPCYNGVARTFEKNSHKSVFFSLEYGYGCCTCFFAPLHNNYDNCVGIVISNSRGSAKILQ